MMLNEAMGGDPRRMRGNRYSIASYAILQADSSRDGQNLRDANQIVGGCRQHEEPFDQRAPAMSGFAQPTHGLHPAECFFDLLSLDGANAIAGMAGRARVDCRAAASASISRFESYQAARSRLYDQ